MSNGARNPYEDQPSCETEACDIGDCKEPWAWEAERRNGPRKLRLCEAHADHWLLAERELEAEREELRGRHSVFAPLFALARLYDGRSGRAL